MAGITISDDRDPHVSPDDDRYEELQAGIGRRIGDYDSYPAVEELAAAWRIRNRGASPEPAPEPEIEDEVVDYSIEPW